MLFDALTDKNSAVNKKITDKESDIQKIEELYLNCRTQLFKIAINIVKDYQLAEDVCQTIFVVLIETGKYKYLLNLRDEEMKAYLIVMARNTSLNIKKSKVSEEVLITETNSDIVFMNSNSYNMEQNIVDSMTYDEVMNIMYELPDDYTDVMFAKYCYGYNNKQISKQFNLSECTVRKRIERGIKKIIKIYSGGKK